MIAAWMLFAIEVSALLFASAWLAERALRLFKKPVRGVWAAAIVGANLLPLLLVRIPSVAAVARRVDFGIAPESVLTRLNTPLVMIWGTAAAMGLIICASAVIRLSRSRAQWKTEHVDRTPVLVSHDVGPALVGVMQYSIVVPQWANTLGDNAKQLLIRHEREHARTYDPLLFAVGALAVVVAPWNLFNWLFFRRLHLAVELDCDQRVLRAHPDTRQYGALLLDVAERVLPSVMPAAAFVEHGVSLETRINAMSDRKQSYRKLRAASGLALSLTLAAAACFTPRPYVIIVNPTAPVSAHEVEAALKAPIVMPAPSQTDLDKRELVAGVARSLQREILPETPRRESLVDDAGELRPVPPSARVKALDDAENERMRSIVARSAPRALGNLARADSALVLLFRDDGSLLTQTGISMADVPESIDPMYVFGKLFISPDINGIQSASRFTIDRGANNEPLQTPLTLFTAYQVPIPGLPRPRMVKDVLPSRDAMIADVQARHPEAIGNPGVASVVALIYDTKGTLINSSVVSLDSVRRRSAGDLSERRTPVNRPLFDGWTVVYSGAHSMNYGNGRGTGPIEIQYAVVLTKSEFLAIDTLVNKSTHNWTFGGIRLIDKSQGGISTQSISDRLRALVQSRVPDAYGDWPRAEKALMFLLDANDELVGLTSIPLPQSDDLGSLANRLSLRFLDFPSTDIGAVGWTNHVTSSSGRVLDKPLRIVWGRLSVEATRQRELNRRQSRQ